MKMNNSYLVGTGECLGYCSVVPEVGEEHGFGDHDVKFAYTVGELLFFKPSKPQNLTIENNFKYHAPKEGQPEKYTALREKAKELAYLIEELCPNSREKSLAMTKLEESIMWANASVARN